MAYLQEQVLSYVLADPTLFVAEERSLHFGDGLDDNWWIDLLIVDPWQKIFFLGEVTYDPRPRRLVEKLKKFSLTKPVVLTKLGRSGAPEGWDIRPWLFIREETLGYILQRLPEECKPRITFLEQTLEPWKYEKIRKEGKEPGRPYPNLSLEYQE
ncbi:hypothetical protein [Pseudolabrys sp. FHR47]|uniref:hypothetical protein n=1 Tax=Pseudolabrys sp. FHR47 TaxID=2562284 RepID=UPI0010BF31E7|nr:hypothetical protein [Pseudolabrys sp. FHR47]